MTAQPPVPPDTSGPPVPPDSPSRPARDRATFLAWASSALPRAFAGALAPPLRGPLDDRSPLSATLPRPALEAAWTLASRDIAARLALACVRERLVAGDLDDGLLRPSRAPRLTLPVARRHAFGLHRPDLTAPRDPALEHPLLLLARVADDLSLEPATRARVAAELADSAFNLAVALVVAELRARARLAGRAWPAPVDPENLVVAGHPWHPMCKTRLGLRLHDTLRHAPEALARGTLHAVDVAASHSVAAGAWYDLAAAVFPPAPAGWLRLPVHALQRRRLPRLLGDAWGPLVRPAACMPRAGRALLSLRTVALADLHLKLAADMHTTSARRQVSPMSVHNGPELSRLLARILAADPLTRGLRVQPEPAAAGLDPARFGPLAGQLGVLLRPDPAPLARALADEADASPVPSDSLQVTVCAALGERWPAADPTLRNLHRDPTLLHRRTGDPLLRSFAAAHDGLEPALRRYVDLLVPPALRLLVAHGVALELHLQNTLVVHHRGRLRGFIVRDLGGVRLHRERMRRAGHHPDLAPGSFLATDDLLEVQTKLAHTLFHAHLGAVFAWAADLGADPDALWHHTHDVTRAALRRFAADPRLTADCAADEAALLAPTVRAKALLRMRLDERVVDYAYIDVDGP